MMIEDTDLTALFHARAASLPEPSPVLFTRTMARIALPHRSSPIAAWYRRLRQRSGFALAAALILMCSIFGISQLTSHRPADVVAFKTNPVEMPAPAPKMIKINTLKSDSRSAAAAKPEPAAANIPAIARATTIALLVRDVPAALAALDGVARANGGFVTNLSDTAPADAGAVHVATATLIVDARRLDATMKRIATLGAQQSRTATGESVGDTIVDDQARLRNLRREERDLLRIMDRSGNVDGILHVESKLADVRGEIERLTAELAGTQHRVATSQIDVTLTEARPTATPATPTLGDHLDATWHAALRAVVAVATGIVDLALWLAAFAPFWIVAGLAAIAIALRRRSRF